jgi:hypothetical protein
LPPVVTLDVAVFMLATNIVMARLVPRLSGLILVDEAHGMDSSVF